MAEEKIPLVYKGHPLRRKDNLIYYGSMADKYIIMMQIMDTKKVDDLDVASRVSVQLQLTDPDLKSRAQERAMRCWRLLIKPDKQERTL